VLAILATPQDRAGASRVATAARVACAGSYRGGRRLDASGGFPVATWSWRWLQIELDDGISELTAPAVIAAFEGWNDAGEAASAAISHLSAAWPTNAIGEIDPEDYYDFQVTRPVLEVAEGQTRRLSWPTTKLAVARPPAFGRDLIMVHGIEPNMRWKGFCSELVGAFSALGAEMVVLLGALLADSPHTRPVPVNVAASDEKLAAALQIEPVDYQGPTGIVGVLQDACTTAGIPAVSLWAAVPHYVAQPPSPKATLALLRGVEDILDAPMPLGDLPDEARAWERGVDELAAQDSDVAEYVRTLEEAKDATDLPEASGDAIAREFERYLRRRGEHGGTR
jgi:proteasome assembly chaperone (PAC2) family protein